MRVLPCIPNPKSNCHARQTKIHPNRWHGPTTYRERYLSFSKDQNTAAHLIPRQENSLFWSAVARHRFRSFFSGKERRKAVSSPRTPKKNLRSASQAVHLPHGALLFGGND